ncbi:hypothetical protein AtNW77_Chr1g0005451 [Arabidopsis thaliana]
MDHIAAAEEQIVTERIRRKLEEVNATAQSQLSPIQDHINFTLQVYVICVLVLILIRVTNLPILKKPKFSFNL